MNGPGRRVFRLEHGRSRFDPCQLLARAPGPFKRVRACRDAAAARADQQGSNGFGELPEPQLPLPFFVLEISTPWPGSNESEPICCTTSIV